MPVKSFISDSKRSKYLTKEELEKTNLPYLNIELRFKNPILRNRESHEKMYLYSKINEIMEDYRTEFFLKHEGTLKLKPIVMLDYIMCVIVVNSEVASFNNYEQKRKYIEDFDIKEFCTDVYNKIMPVCKKGGKFNGVSSSD